MLYERWDVDQNQINRIELNKIAEKIKDYLKDFESHHNIMMNDYRIINNFDYYRYVRDLVINPSDALIYIGIDFGNTELISHFPFIVNGVLVLDAYLSRQGFHYEQYVVPANGLRYLALARLHRRKALIEILDLNITANRLNIPRIVKEVLANNSTKELEGIDLSRLTELFVSQKILAGHSLQEAFSTFVNYHDKKGKVARIIVDYNRIFTPLYRACYETETWETWNKIDCPSFNLESLI